MTGKHTPTPWQVGKNSTTIFAADGFAVAKAEDVVLISKSYLEGNVKGHWALIPGAKREEVEGEAEANAKHIVHCVNLHDELARALSEARSMLKSCGLVEPDEGCQEAWNRGLATIDAALAKAGAA